MKKNLLSNLAQAGRAVAWFKHTWADDRKVGLNSMCMRCSAVIATNMDELSLLAVEQMHVCIEQYRKELPDQQQVDM
jgi:hypothetical protein